MGLVLLILLEKKEREFTLIIGLATGVGVVGVLEVLEVGVDCESLAILFNRI